MSKTDFYDLLGVSRSATTAEIKAAYRKMAMKYHPDRNPGNAEAEKKFKAASEAYDVLSSDQKRQQYDQMGHSAYKQTGGTGPGGHGGMNMDDIFENFGDIFGSMFGGGHSRRRGGPRGPVAQRGHDLKQALDITLKESFTGTEKEVGYYRFLACKTCDAKGVKPGTSIKTCMECKGEGKRVIQQGFFMYEQACGTCSGHGYQIESPCTSCRGQCRTQQYDKFTVTIPKGIYDTAELRVTGRGDAGIYGGQSGDLFIKVSIKPDPIFKRVKDDLVRTVRLTYPQLVLGCQIEVESIDGASYTFKIPRGCQGGDNIIKSGAGFQRVNSSIRGNFVVVTECYIPKKITPEERKNLLEYSDMIGSDVQKNEASGGFFKRFLG